MEVSKKDWNLFREKLPDWQERWMERLSREYIALLSSGAGNASDRFRALCEHIRIDQRSPGVSLELRRSTMVYDLARLLADGVIREEELKGFSEDTQEAVRALRGIGQGV